MSEKGILGSKIGIAVIVAAVVVVGGIAGFLVLNSGQGPATEYYAVSYHWGFAFYDKDFNEVQNMTVNQSAHVRIYLLSASGLTQELHEVYEERTMDMGIGSEHNMTVIMEAMEEAEDAGKLNHGIIISGSYGSKGAISTDIDTGVVDATSIQDLATKLQEKNKLPVLDFTADTKGNFNIICTIDCGEYHADMIAENALRVI